MFFVSPVNNLPLSRVHPTCGPQLLAQDAITYKPLVGRKLMNTRKTFFSINLLSAFYSTHYKNQPILRHEIGPNVSCLFPFIYLVEFSQVHPLLSRNPEEVVLIGLCLNSSSDCERHAARTTGYTTYSRLDNNKPLCTPCKVSLAPHAWADMFISPIKLQQSYLGSSLIKMASVRYNFIYSQSYTTIGSCFCGHSFLEAY